jgi:GTP-binding protein
VLLFVLDTAGSEGRHPIEDLQSLRREIDLYDSRLSARPWCIVANKMDLPESRENLQALRNRFPEATILAVSANEGEGISELKEHLGKWGIDTGPRNDAFSVETPATAAAD